MSSLIPSPEHQSVGIRIRNFEVGMSSTEDDSQKSTTCFAGFERQRAICKWFGVSLSADNKAVLNYNPGIFQAGVNFLLALPFLPGLQTIFSAHLLQLLCLYGVMHFYWHAAGEDFPANMYIQACYDNVAGLSRFVLGLFISLVLSRTYYANRGVFGTVFGSTMGCVQMVCAYVRVPPSLSGNPEAKRGCKQTQDLIIRFMNAAFRLMWLEAVPGRMPDDIGEEMLREKLLTEAEWSKIKDLKSRCTHIYQWVANLLGDLCESSYLTPPILACVMLEVDKCRGANVWGLPSLPILYTHMITHMVKIHLLFLALADGASLTGTDDFWTIVVIHFDLAVQHYLFQGALDLHGSLYNPNAGIFLGHLPALDFMAFVRNVTENLARENDEMPFTTNLVKPCRKTDTSL